MNRRDHRGVLLLGLVLVCASCKSDEAGDRAPVAGATSQQPTTQKLGRHWVQDARLREVMDAISKRMRDDYPKGLPSDPEQPTPPEIERAYADAARLADALAKGAERIPHAIEGNAFISAADRAGFLEEARTLRDHALQLKATAGERRLEGMQRSLLGINATCIACHSKYKDISGEINFPTVRVRAADVLATAARATP